MHHIADVGALCSWIQMIELQNDDVAFTTADARMLRQELRDTCACSIPLQRVVATVALGIRSFIVDVVAPRYLAAAGAASRVPLSSAHILESEIREWPGRAASRTKSIGLAGHLIV